MPQSIQKFILPMQNLSPIVQAVLCYGYWTRSQHKGRNVVLHFPSEPSVLFLLYIFARKLMKHLIQNACYDEYILALGERSVLAPTSGLHHLLFNLSYPEYILCPWQPF